MATGGGVEQARRAFGVLVNPIAGYGGTRAMHGTHDLDTEQHLEALDLARAAERMRRALGRAVDRLPSGTTLTTCAGPLGADLLTSMGLEHRVVGDVPPDPTTAADTARAASAVVGSGVDCLVFSGGDGTAADLAPHVGETPVIGVPAGVKMHSGIFARTPEAAGDLVVAVAEGRVRYEPCDLLDVVRDDGLQVMGSVSVPAARTLLQGPKQSSGEVDGPALAALGRQLADAAGPDAQWVLGPGTTVEAVARGMGLVSTVRGVDVVAPGGEATCDVDEERLADAVARHDTHVLLGVVGGQGFLLGRGNQELSARVLQAIDPARIHVVAAASKLTALVPPVLHVDLGDTRPVQGLDGYRPVHVGPGRTTIMRITSSAVTELPALA